jgi:hypothetical protein
MDTGELCLITISTCFHCEVMVAGHQNKGHNYQAAQSTSHCIIAYYGSWSNNSSSPTASPISTTTSPTTDK